MILNRSVATIMESPQLFSYFSKVLEEPVYVHFLKETGNLKIVFVLDANYNNLAEAGIRELKSGRCSIGIELHKSLFYSEFGKELAGEIKQFRSKTLQNVQ